MSLQYVEQVLRDEWHDEIDGRPHNVGHLDDDVKIVYEGSKEWRRMDLSNFDYLTLQDGGDVDISPKGLGWTEEDTTSRVNIDIRTKGHHPDRDGRVTLYGETGAGDLDPRESPRWGGLVGETERVMKTIRRGDDCQNSIVNVDVIDDLTGQMGGQIWRSVVQVRFESRNATIDTDPEP